MADSKDYYLLIIFGDIESGLYGPFATAEERDQKAKDHRKSDECIKDGMFRIETTKGTTIEVEDFCGAFFETEE